MKKRIDVLCVEKGLFQSRAKAVMAINSGVVFVEGKKVAKPSETFEEGNSITIEGEILKYVSRGGLKLEGAIKSFNLDLNNKVVLDMGSSTGGFTDCALQNGAKKVIAVDVGKNQMADKLRKNPKVELHEETDVKSLPKSKFFEADIIVADISFVSIVKIMEGIINKLSGQKLMLLVKPQFECGKVLAQKHKGVIKDFALSRQIADETIKKLENLGLTLEKLDNSPITGGDGNHEFITLFKSPQKAG